MNVCIYADDFIITGVTKEVLANKVKPTVDAFLRERGLLLSPEKTTINKRGKGEMIKTSGNLQELRRKIYIKAKADKSWRFWGIYVHVCKMETLKEAYRLAKRNNGAPGIDGVTFEELEETGVEGFLQRIRHELNTRTYYPMRNRQKEIPKGGGKTRTLGELHSVTSAAYPTGRG